LAEIYRKRGDLASAKGTLDEFLTKVEDHGLDHATVRVAIANDLMKDGRYAEAWPYAEAAAQTWAGWAMTCAQNCAEGLKNWEAAEGYARAVAERYPKSGWNQWLMFCERTGHGDLAAARAWTKEVSAQLLENPQASTDSLFLITYVQLLCGDKAKAAAALRRMPKDDAKDESEQTTVIVVAALADFAGADEVRDAALERFCTSFQKSSPRAAKVLQMIRDAVAAKKPGVLDLKTVDEVVANIPGQFKARTAFAMAAHLMAHGHPAEAKRFWTIAANPNNNSWWSFLARSVLRERYPKDAGGRTGPREI
jgi:tetratricopeptide (TPR) repeat protein